MRKTECANVENRISAQEGVSWLLCSLKIKGPKSYPPPFLEHCVAHLFRRLDWAAFGNDALLDGKKLCRAAFFAKILQNAPTPYFALSAPPATNLQSFGS